MSDDKGEKTVLVRINVFGISIEKAEIPKLAQHLKDKTDPDELMLSVSVSSLRSLFGSAAEFLTEDELGRYIKLTDQQTGAGITPVGHKVLEERIIPSLATAKKLATTGEFLASIALCGYVGEVLSVLVWEAKFIPKFGVVGNRAVGSFSNLSQSMRVNVLGAFGCINGDDTNRFKAIAGRRNDALHPWTKDLTKEKLEEMTVQSYGDAYNLLHHVLGVRLASAGSIEIDNDFLKLLA